MTFKELCEAVLEIAPKDCYLGVTVSAHRHRDQQVRLEFKVDEHHGMESNMIISEATPELLLAVYSDHRKREEISMESVGELELESPE